MVIANERGEQQLAEHIAKALSAEETAPKQKHVRACIVYTHDLKSSGTVFLGLKNHPVMGNDILTWKTLILFHKIISQGHYITTSSSSPHHANMLNRRWRALKTKSNGWINSPVA
ncbi:MAG: hypothetical protein SGCHY_000914 [Lobulomycetales sp.]